MTLLMGMDGCRTGWVCASARAGGGPGGGPERVELQVYGHIFHALDRDPGLAVVDMPIGLLEAPRRGGRTCDREARRLLGRPRASSVFSPPVRPLLNATDYASVRGRGLTLQAFHLLPRIRELDAVVTPGLQSSCVREGHPEVTFRLLAGAPVVHPKRRAAGRNERLQALLRGTRPSQAAYLRAWEGRRAVLRHGAAAPDDVLDALAMLATAFRIRAHRARRLPPDPPRDARGLRMEIWA